MENQPQQPDELPIPEGMVLVIDGRTFRGVSETSFEQDLYIGSMLKDAGLIKMAEGFNPAKDEISDVAMEIIATAFASGKLFDLLGGTMEEVGVPWSIPEAKKNAQFFSQLRKASDKKKLHGAIVGILMGFFISGAVSSKTSLKYSSPEDRAEEDNLLHAPGSHPGASGGVGQ
jgi:hypothetical protein